MSPAGFAAAATLATLLAGPVMGGERFTLFWSTVDGGGTTLARSARFMVAGTIGQPDAGATDPFDFQYWVRSGFFDRAFPLPAFEIFRDGFESGDRLRWSASVPPGP